MRFGIYAEMQCPDDKPFAALYDEVFRQMVHADEVGFDSYSIIEHHLFRNFGISANPLAMIAAVAPENRKDSVSHTPAYASVPQSLKTGGGNCGCGYPDRRPTGLWYRQGSRVVVWPAQCAAGGKPTTI